MDSFGTHAHTQAGGGYDGAGGVGEMEFPFAIGLSPPPLNPSLPNPISPCRHPPPPKTAARLLPCPQGGGGRGGAAGAGPPGADVSLRGATCDKCGYVGWVDCCMWVYGVDRADREPIDPFARLLTHTDQTKIIRPTHMPFVCVFSSLFSHLKKRRGTLTRTSLWSATPTSTRTPSMPPSSSRRVSQ